VLTSTYLPTTMTDKPTTLSASKLGEYNVHTDIAEGTFGKVRSEYTVLPGERKFDQTFVVGTHTLTGHKVAMKYISKAVIHLTKTKTRVQREVEYMRTLRHPHIIKLYVLYSYD
jgi:carbon catabolite-derepressing protein kinase